MGKHTESVTPGTESRTPQTRNTSSPYHVKEVIFSNDVEGVRLAGTVTWPGGDSPGPAVILIPGGGAHDRDYSIGRHRPFHVLADYLTRRGIPVLRFDERGVGGSTGDPAKSTCENYAGDVLAGVRFLQRFGESTSEGIGLIGHSEGGMVASLAAEKSGDIAFLVLLATPGLPGREYQMQYEESTGKAMGLSEEAIARRRSVQEAVFEVLLREHRRGNAETQIREIYRQYFPGIPEERIRAGLARFLSPGFRYNLTYDPASVLPDVRCPVLAIYGERDLHVPPERNAARMEEILRNRPDSPPSKVITLPGLNHFFQAHNDADPFNYGTNEEAISPVVPDTIASCIKNYSNWDD